MQFSNLQRLENLIRQIKPPAWPGKIDDQLAAKGKDIFDRRPKDGGCGPGCHREEKGEARLCNSDTWKTPRQPVGTDIREYRGLGRVGDTGVLAGQIIPGLPFATLKSTDSVASVLKTSVAQSVIQAPLKYGAFTFAPILAECLKNKEANPLGAIEFLAENTQDILRQGLGELYKFPAASAHRIRIPRLARRLGHGPLSAQRFRAHALGVVETAGGARLVLQDRSRL